MSGRLRIAARELASLRREKTILLAILIQLFIAAFSSFLLVGLVSMYDPGAVSGSETTIGVTGETRAALVNAIRDQGDWDFRLYSNAAEARRAFTDGAVDTVFVTRRADSGRIDVRVLVPDSSIRSTVIVVAVRDALRAFERSRREALAESLERLPIPVPDVPPAPPTTTFTYTVLLPLLVFLPAFISGSIAVDTITEEVDRGTLSLLLVTPLSAGELLDGKMLATIGIAPVQTAAWLGLLWANGTRIAEPIAIIGFVAALAALLVLLGTWLALAFNERQAAQLLYSLGVLGGFGLATLLPESPPNTVAKLALGSAEEFTYGLLLGYGTVAIVGYWAVRRDGADRLLDR